jgi:tetratricopeptide (TPR) repeat protein
MKALIWFELGNREQWHVAAEKAKVGFKDIVAMDPIADPDFWSNLAICYALTGERDLMEKTISEVRAKTSSANWHYRRGDLTEMHIAICYLVLGDNDKAIETLEAASKMDGPIFLNRELDLWFIFDRLRGDPRFDALLED